MLFKRFHSLTIIIVLMEIHIPINARIIQTTSGPVKGKGERWKSVNYYSYEGIPYAESPSGHLRFMPPIPKKPWTSILDATREGAVCPQEEKKYPKEKMSEDCLFLNIYVPANTKRDMLPVFVFVHGGAFRWLSGNTDILYGPQFFLQHDLIFVTMNYRLGALGFLSLDTEEAAGNAGIKDIILSLKWINKNIERFGGDPNKITIGGHSSGATIIHYLLISKQSINLFQQAIVISGSAINARSLSKYPKDKTYILAEELGLQTNDDQKLLNRLKEVDVFDIINAEANLSKYDEVVLRPYSLFTPSIEKESSHAIITTDPNELSILPNISILTGFNYREGIYVIPKMMSKPHNVKKLRHNMELSIPSNIEYPIGSESSLALAKSIGEYYFNIGLTNFTLNNIIDLASDSQFIYATDAWIKRYKALHTSNVLYYYIFDFDGDLNWAKLRYNINFPGTAHADELGYIFITQETEALLHRISYKSNLVKNILTTLLSNFIKFGNPTPESFTSNFKWPEYSKNGSLLVINENPTIGSITNPLLDRLEFWNDVYEKYYSYVKNGGKLEKKALD